MKTMQQLKNASNAKMQLQTASDLSINEFLENYAKMLVEKMAEILNANKQDLEKMESSNPKYDRLKLNEKRI